MKRLLTNFLALSSVALLMLTSCKKNDTTVVNSGSKSSGLTVNTTTPALDKSKIADTSAVIMFNFTAPTYNYKAVVSNSLQIDAEGDNWKNPASAPLGKNGSHGYSILEFDKLLLKLNLPAGEPAKVNVRIVNALSPQVASYSNVITLTVTPFNLSAWIYVVGAFQGWNAASPDSLLSETGNGIYTGVINFGPQTGGNNQFLILPAKSFDNKYATTGGPDTTTTSSNYTTELVSSGGNNFVVKNQGGTYLLTLNANTNVLTIVPANHYSVIGDAALGWDPGDDTEMKYVNDGNGLWVSTLPLKSTGAFKVRQNDDWTYSWGIPKAGEAGDGVPSTLNDTKNDNITVAASGNYTVTFYNPMTVVSSTYVPPVTTTYTVTKK